MTTKTDVRVLDVKYMTPAELDDAKDMTLAELDTTNEPEHCQYLTLTHPWRTSPMLQGEPRLTA
ncbi:hypothetical protein [Streptomyces alfalfae]|uniref:hypothetical protein n=1 Tax=Streptomyces alfalfae TaxID=1642299 RepID=UPI002811D656|nr:hypothetical protein [Streptomyces alfalfae]